MDTRVIPKLLIPTAEISHKADSPESRLRRFSTRFPAAQSTTEKTTPRATKTLAQEYELYMLQGIEEEEIEEADEILIETLRKRENHNTAPQQPQQPENNLMSTTIGYVSTISGWVSSIFTNTESISTPRFTLFGSTPKYHRLVNQALEFEAARNAPGAR